MSKLKQQYFCPICENDNLCDVNNEKGCWCANINVPTELINTLTDQPQNKRCICQACIEKFKLGKAI